MEWHAYRANPTDWFSYAITAKEFAEIKVKSIDLSDTDWPRAFEIGIFKKRLFEAQSIMDKINQRKDWCSEIYVSPMFCLDGGGEMFLMFWRKAYENGSVYVVSECELINNTADNLEPLASFE